MEEKMSRILDDLTIDETERLLDRDTPVAIDLQTKNRIKNSVFQKTGLKNKRKTTLFKKFVACAAAFAILLSSFYMIGFDHVAAAMSKIFSFIPGVGIMEDNDTIEYILSKPASAENNDIVIHLNHAVATSDSITVMFSIERKNYTDEQLYKDKQEEWARLQKDGALSHSKVNLYAGNVKYTEYSGFTGSGGQTETSTFSYSMKVEDVTLNTTYRLELEEYNVSVDFKLKRYDSYDALEEIGSTAYNNDISITAVPAFTDGKVEVDLYSINKSGFYLESYNKTNNGYLCKDLQLETDSGIKTYIIPDGYGGANGKFIFDIQPGDKNFTLKIPYITVHSSEAKNITLKIPKDGEKITVNKRIEFNDCTMILVDVEKTLPQNMDEFGELKITIKYDNHAKNKIMARFGMMRTDFFGTPMSGSWSGSLDENDILTTVYYTLEKNDGSKLRLKISNPVYYLTDGYTLKFSR
jgi:hypothetical protein